MRDFNKLKQEITENGFTVIEEVFSDSNIEAIINAIHHLQNEFENDA